jgi:purine-nucleoside phosphorylase
MESFGLFMMAKMFKKHAACLLTVSDILETKLAMSSYDRETKFKNMIHLALEAIIKEKE